jgi:hypothetical protein
LALDVGEWSLSRSLRKEAPVHIGREIGWTPELVWMMCKREISLGPAGNWTFQPAAIPYIDSAIWDPRSVKLCWKIRTKEQKFVYEISRKDWNWNICMVVSCFNINYKQNRKEYSKFSHQNSWLNRTIT